MKKTDSNVEVNEKVDNVVAKENKKTKKGSIFILLIFIAVIALAVIMRLNYKEEEAVLSIPVVDTMIPGHGDIYDEVSVTGTILPKETLAVVCKVQSGGEVKKIYVKNGDYVHTGDPICEIDNQKQIDAAYITYDTAKKAYSRMSALYKAGDISRQNYEQVKAQYDGAKLAYDTQVEFATPTATGDGYVENTNMTEGLGVDYKDVLCYITSDDGVDIQFGVTENVIKGIKIGDNIVVEKDDNKYNAIIYDKASLISQKTGLFDIKASIVDNGDFANGSMAKATVIFDESKNTMIIPRSVVYYENEIPRIYYLDNENKVRVAVIETGIETDQEIEVMSGITGNTKIISTWNNDLIDGTEVKEIESTKYEVIKKVGRKNDSKRINTIKRATANEISKPFFDRLGEKGEDKYNIKYRPQNGGRFKSSNSDAKFIPYDRRNSK